MSGSYEAVRMVVAHLRGWSLLQPAERALHYSGIIPQVAHTGVTSVADITPDCTGLVVVVEIYISPLLHKDHPFANRALKAFANWGWRV